MNVPYIFFGRNVHVCSSLKASRFAVVAVLSLCLSFYAVATLSMDTAVLFALQIPPFPPEQSPED